MIETNPTCKCGTEISEHEAGSCLDRFIAELLGWKICLLGGNWWINRYAPFGKSQQLPLPHYSEDLNCATELMDEGVLILEKTSTQYLIWDGSTPSGKGVVIA